ncbi:MAG TPA: hypothetical protein VFR34_01690 [Paracoccaceae bacterium]|nr:hypothetical protein [Paracoccaceae bacterium]
MILPLGFVLGFALGWWRARARGGSRLDKLQYGAAHGIAGLLIALVATLILDRLGVL